MYNIEVMIPCERYELVSIWWKICRLGYKLEYKSARAYLYGYNKNTDDIAALEERLIEYPDRLFYAHSVEDNRGWGYVTGKE